MKLTKNLTVAFSFIASLSFFYKISIEKKIVDYNISIDRNWKKITNFQMRKNEILKKNTFLSDTLINIFKNRSFFNDLPSDSITNNYIVLEKELNKVLIKDMKTLNFLNKDLNKQLNNIIFSYNGQVKDYNIYYMSFPNYIFAKNKFNKKKRFNLEYKDYKLESLKN